MRIKYTLLATAICLKAVYGADLAAIGAETHGRRGGGLNKPYLAGHPKLEDALKQATRKQTLSATAARELSGALFDSELAQLVLCVLQNQRDSIRRGIQPTQNETNVSVPKASNTPSIFQVTSAPPSNFRSNSPTKLLEQPVSMACQHGRQFDMNVAQQAPQVRQHNPNGQQGGIFGYDIVGDNLTTTTFDDFIITDESGNEIPHARHILEILKQFAAPTAEVPEDQRRSKLLYLQGEPGKGKTTAAVILMRELAKRGHKCIYVSSEQINNYSFDLSKLTYSVVVVDDLNEYPLMDTLEKKLRKFILAAYDKPSVRIVITSNKPFSDLKKLLTQWYIDRNADNSRRIDNADQIESRFLTMCKRSGAPSGLDFSTLPMRRK